MEFNKENLRIIFLGTPLFAQVSLAKLVSEGFNVVAVVTAPDKPSGRGMQMQQSAVKQFALEKNIPVLQPEKLKNNDFIEVLKSYKADIQIVVAFRMLPELVWQMPQLGTINVHGSLLPKYRGAAPINWAIINGETETGVTTFQLVQEIDKGAILLHSKFEILPKDDVGIVHDKMMFEGAALLIKTIKGILDKSIIPVPQLFDTANDDKFHAPKIFTYTCKIDFNNTALQIVNLIRGLSPYPTSFCDFHSKKLKIFKAELTTQKHTKESGIFLSDGKTFIDVCVGNNEVITLKEIQLEGKKRMLVADFLRGYKWL